MASGGITVVSMAAVMAVVVIAGAPSAHANHTAAHEAAQAGLSQTAQQAGLGTQAPELPVIIGNLINAALSMLGIIFLILMLYGGYIWMQAKGNTEDIEKAKKIIENAIIGIVVIGLAFAITAFVIDRITEAQVGTTLGGR